MIEELRIDSLGVIDSAVLELRPGLTVVTGETGAGKTMVVTALGLILGERADSGLVRAGTPQARVEGRLAVAADSPIAATTTDAGGGLDDGVLIVGRTVASNGRSRASLGGASVPATLLATMAGEQVSVVGQSEQQRLLAPSRQRQALDRYAGPDVGEPLACYRLRYERLVAVEAELDDVVDHARERAREADMLRFGLDEISEVDPQPGEDERLEVDESRLAHADALRAAAESARAAFVGDDMAVDGTDALGLVGQARHLLDSVREHDDEIAGLADRAAEVSYLLADLAADLAAYASDVDADPVQLATIAARRNALAGLTRKYGYDVAEVLAWAAESSIRLAQLDGADDRIDSLRAERLALRGELSQLAAVISAARRAAAERFSAAVTTELTELAMPHARLIVDVRQRDDANGLSVLDAERAERELAFGPHGTDEVELLLAANAGAPSRPLAKSASGGELSRVMLAVEVTFAGTDPVPTIVFDEVDAGVGGAAAVEVGRRLARLARHAQVLVVTHLPQVAAFADQHCVVVKDSGGLVTTSGVQTLDHAGRVRELSRMLAGMQDSTAAQAHAEELLNGAQGAESVTSGRARQRSGNS